MTFVPSAEQAAIIDAPLGPLRVSAGAGTGKTTTIVERLVRAIDGGLAPERTLGLTFSNKAAEELAERLRIRLPRLAAEGREVEVTTYHGFAFSILREFGALVGVERDARIIGAGFTISLYSEAVQSGTYTELDLTAPQQRVREAAALGQQLSGNLVHPSRVPFVDDEIGRKRRELAGVVGRYQDLKSAANVLDYGDLIGKAHELVTTYPEVAQSIRTRYDTALLDEYQDTDPAQRMLLQAIFGEGFPITAVGDVDQTIYEWRGASLENFNGFPVHFRQASGSPALTLPLTLNRRSGQLILDVANAIRGKLHDANFESLIATDDAAQAVVETRRFISLNAEATWIADEIHRLSLEEGIEWREIAILVRKNKSIGLIRQALEDRGIPVDVASLGGLLDIPIVSDLYAWLRFLAHPEDSPAVVRVLLGSRFRLGLGDLAPLVQWTRQGRTEPTHQKSAGSLIEAIEVLQDIPGLDNEARSRLEEFRTMYRKAIVGAQHESLATLCRNILDLTAIWSEIDALPPAASLSARLDLYRFLDLAGDWSPLTDRPSLETFVAYLEILSDESAAEELDTARPSQEDAVRLLTVHRGKGLEWDTVFLPSLDEGVFPTKPVRFDNPLKSAQSLPFELRLDPETFPVLNGVEKDDIVLLRASHAAQEWRTAYVAVTRAKRRLYATGAHWHTGVRSKKPSDLYNTIAQVAGVFAHPDTEAGNRPDRLTLSDHTPTPDPHFPSGWKQALKAAADGHSQRPTDAALTEAYDAAVKQLGLHLDGLADPPDDETATRPAELSVTSLVTLGDCAKRYYWSHVDPLPRRRTGAMAAGTALHRRIELHNRGTIGFDEELIPDVVDTVPGEADRGVTAFAAFADSPFGSTSPIFTEVAIDLHLEAGRVRGRIDAVYQFEPDTWDVVDFKSGRPKTGENRFLQLAAYALAIRNGALGSMPDRLFVSFVYLGGGKLVHEQVEATQVWLDEKRDAINSLLTEATGEAFATSPSPACHYCDFSRFCDAGTQYIQENGGSSG